MNLPLCRTAALAIAATAIAATAFAATAFAADSGFAENWSQFRGGAAGGVVDRADLPTVWSADSGVAWKAELPGVGWSQPIIWDDRVFVTAAEADNGARPDPSESLSPGFGDRGIFGAFSEFKPPQITVRWRVFCLDAATGDVLWQRVAREGPPAAHIHPNNTYATETPATDGKLLIASFGMNGVYCYDFDGRMLWSKDLDAHPTQFGWGAASSPLVFDGMVYLQCDNDEASSLVALDLATGEQRWRVPRDELSNWSTPYLWRNKVRTEVVAAGGARMRSYDPRSGELLWECVANGRTATTPVGDQDLLFVDSYNRLTGTVGVVAAIRAGAVGDVTPADGQTTGDFVAWTLPLAGNRIASPVLAGTCLYILDQNGGVVRCLDAATGRQHYRKRVRGAAGFVGSPLAAGDRVYLVDQNGCTSILAAGAEYQLVASNELGEMCWSTPAAADGRLLIRTVNRLYCVGKEP